MNILRLFSVVFLFLYLFVPFQNSLSAEFNPTTTQELIDDIQTANANGESDVINLVENMVYTITGSETGVPFSDGNGNNGLPVILDDSGNSLTINGNGATIQRDPSLFTDADDPCSGAGLKFRLVQVQSGAQLVLNNNNLKYGCALLSTSSGPPGGGGAVFNLGNVIFNNSNLSHNAAIGTRNSAGGGGISSIAGSIDIFESVLSNNKATISGSIAGGGGIFSDGSTLNILDSTISGNSSNSLGGGILIDRSNIFIVGTTISDNVSTGSGGGLHIDRSDTIMTNSTISGNTGHGIFLNRSSLSLTMSTVTNNICTSGSCGIAGGVIGTGDAVNIKNSILAGNKRGNITLNCSFSIIEGNLNFIDENLSDSNADNCAAIFNADLDVESMLGPLQDNGGPTFTHALLQPPGTTNPAIDSVTDCTDQDDPANPITHDQRGVLRIFGACDVGAYEFLMSPPGCIETQKIIASDGALNDEFGTSVSVWENYIIVGAPFFGASQPGKAYIFERDMNDNWSEAEILSGSDSVADDKFGTSVSISGDWAVVGASNADVTPVGESTNFTEGKVYVFNRDSNGDWIETQILTPSDGEGGERFGSSVAIWGDFIIVGAPGAGTLAEQGQAYIFERDISDNWNEVDILTASDAGGGDEFGSSVSIWEGRAVVGAIFADIGGLGNHGVTYVFEMDGMGDWNEVDILTASDSDNNDSFGNSVDIYEDYIIVGARFGDFVPDGGSEEVNRGKAYIFERDMAGDWNEVNMLIASDGEADDEFGSGVTIFGEKAFVGAALANVDPPGSPFNPDQGKAYKFNRDPINGWTEQQIIIASDGASPDHFGESISLYETTSVVGGNRARPGSIVARGAAWIFEIAGKLFIAKQSEPPGEMDFEFTGTGFPASCELDGTFMLDDQTFDFCTLIPSTYSVRETDATSGFSLDKIECFESQSFSVTDETVTIDLFEDEVALCLFTNEEDVFQPEDCDMAGDEDGVGGADCADAACDGEMGPNGESCENGTEMTCDDGFDNDADIAVDCADTDCDLAAGCEGSDPSTCEDGIDNDGDGNTSCADGGCNGATGPQGQVCEPFGETICDDGFDNDGNNLIDSSDPNCSVVDNCPDDPNKTEPGECGCGTPDTDSDTDGTADCNDGCPNDVNKISAGVCGCGVADIDTDVDGTFDCNDMCVDDANKTEPGICGCGVADIDTDEDGTPDCNDTCSNDSGNDEDNDMICGDGDNCPQNANSDQADNDEDDIGDVCDDDDDNDGVSDENDNCPLMANEDQADEDSDGEGDACDGMNDNPMVLFDTNSSDFLTINFDNVQTGGEIVIGLPGFIEVESVELSPNVGNGTILNSAATASIQNPDVVFSVNQFPAELDVILDLCSNDENANGVADAEVEVVLDTPEREFETVVDIIVAQLNQCSNEGDISQDSDSGGGACSLASSGSKPTAFSMLFLIPLFIVFRRYYSFLNLTF